MTDIEFPKKLRFLFEPKRYKILWGGRGGGKSWAIARALLITGTQKPLRILCAREFQVSIRDSVHKLLADQIKEMGLEDWYQITNNSIRCINGTEFGFEGLRHNISKIKSYEGADIAWVEEAQAVSKASWEVLIPTIRREGSEIWASLNPELETDNTYQRFIVHPPEDAIVIKANWSDNPWFPDVLRLEMEALKKRDPDAYLHIWEGNCKFTLEGAVYANELRAARAEDRICNIPYTPGIGVQTFWDLGYADLNSIWFVQATGHEFRFIDFYQNQFKKIGHYLEVLQSKGYMYSRHVLPHDASHERLNAEKTCEEHVRSAFPNAQTMVIPNIGKGAVTKGIDTARELFGQCWFDQIKCADGLQVLSYYRYERAADGNWEKVPVHDDASHGADAFRTFAMGIKQPLSSAPKKPPVPIFTGNTQWMGM